MKLCKFLTLLAVIFLTGCGTLEIGFERAPNSTATGNVRPTEAAEATLPLEQPTITAAPQPIPISTSVPPTDTAVPLVPTQAAPTAAPEPQMVQIYLIALEDNGQSGELVGCGDSAIPVVVETAATQEVLRASMEALLSFKDQYYGESGLYNALYQSDLQLERITLENGKAEIYLTGTLMLGGMCDNPRVEAQLTATALQFSTVQEVALYINGKTLAEALSLQG